MLGAELDPKDSNKFTAPPAFKEGRLYRPLTRNVKRSDVIEAMKEIKREIERIGGEGPATSNDLVLLYYQGQEHITEKDHFLLTDQHDGPEENTAVSLDFMTQLLADTRGAQLVLLDVAQDVARLEDANREKHDRVNAQPPPEHQRISFLRLVWLGPKPPEGTPRLLKAWEEKWRDSVNLGMLESKIKAGYQLLIDQQVVRVDDKITVDLRQFTAGKSR